MKSFFVTNNSGFITFVVAKVKLWAKYHYIKRGINELNNSEQIFLLVSTVPHIIGFCLE